MTLTIRRLWVRAWNHLSYLCSLAAQVGSPTRRRDTYEMEYDWEATVWFAATDSAADDIMEKLNEAVCGHEPWCERNHSAMLTRLADEDEYNARRDGTTPFS